MTVYSDSLQPASFRSIPFFVESESFRTGRRVVIHTYPFRDTPMVEDLGKDTQQFSFYGFLVGDNVKQHRDALLKAVQTAGPGPLIHPTMGRLNACLITCTFGENRDKQRVISVQMTFVVADPIKFPNLYPFSKASTKSFLLGTVASANTASQGGFLAEIKGVVGEAQGALHTVQGYANQVRSVIRDASRVFHSVTGLAQILPGGLGLGRYGGHLGGINSALANINRGLSVPGRLNAGISSMLHAGTAFSTSVNRAASSVEHLVQSI